MLPLLLGTLATAASSNAEDAPIKLDTTSWPGYFRSGMNAQEDRSTGKSTSYSGNVWVVTPEQQLRFTGTQVTRFPDGSFQQGSFTWIEDGSAGTKTLIVADPTSKDPNEPSLICRTSAMSADEKARTKAPFALLRNTVVGDRLLAEYEHVAGPFRRDSIFVDPFEQQPVRVMTQRPGVSTRADYFSLVGGVVHADTSQFAAPPGLKCTEVGDDELPALPSVWLWL